MIINIGEFRNFDVCYHEHLGNCTIYCYISFAGFATSVVQPISNAPTTIKSGTVSNNTKETTGIVPSSSVTNSSVNGSASTLPYGYPGVTNITRLSILVNKLYSARPTTIGHHTDPSKSLTSKYSFISNYYIRVYCWSIYILHQRMRFY